MRIQRLVATAAVLAAGLGGAIISAPTATAASGPAQAAVSQTGVTPKSCPPQAPPPHAGPQFRCLSWYPTEAECNAGVIEYITHAPSNGGYCQPAPDGWWGFIHPGP
ncbi:hypothetical protein [Streptomyces sp. BRA346]|uniref:hypothetical protein n=1 Tax=Streptomyces sp. BRA346 TaxID=2878199 RepID=UPI0040635717